MALPRHKKIIGYDGPTGAYTAVNGRLLPITDPGAHIALTDAALLTGLGASQKAAEFAEIAENHGAIRSSR
jgi:hypothetical protein